MKHGLCGVLCLWSLLTNVHAEPLIASEMPSERVRDASQLLSTPARSILADYLDTLSQTQKTEFYVVILKDEPIAQAVRLCDRYQAEWIPRGQGGVFVYSGVDRKYAFTPTPDTTRSVGSEKLQGLFVSAVENPPLRQSLDVVISTPILRIVSAIGQSHLDDTGQRSEQAEFQATRWQIIAGMAGALAILGWVLVFTKLLSRANFGTSASNIPRPGMAYRNPPKRSRNGRSRREGRSERGEEGGGESRPRDRY